MSGTVGRAQAADWQAGRELDAEVARRVFGEEVTATHYTEGGTGRRTVVYSRGPIPLPHYSTDIAAAWLIVERLRGRGWEWHVSYNSITDHLAMVTLFRYEGDQIPEDYEGNADTAPLAICRAALAARADPPAAARADAGGGTP